MKTPAAFIAALFVAARVLAATPPPPTSSEATPVKPGESPTLVAPVPAPAPTPKVAKPKGEKEAVIPGLTIPRPNGTYLGFQLAGGQIKVSFYDKKKKPMAVDVARGLARWPNPRGPGQITTPLNPGGSSLVGAKPPLPPYNYSITINLLQGEGAEAKTVENYQVPFRG